MNVYDFDGTIFRGDSTLLFYLHALRRKPTLLYTLIPQCWNAMLFFIGIIDRQEFKQRFLKVFLPQIEMAQVLDSFWKEHRHRLQVWYLQQKQAGDVILSASPEFLLRPIASELGIELLATDVDEKSGSFRGPNLRGNEKVVAFRRKYGNNPIDSFYTDSLSDLPMAKIANEAFLVKRGKVQRLAI